MTLDLFAWGTRLPKIDECDGSGATAWDADAYENVECKGCPKCRCAGCGYKTDQCTCPGTAPTIDDRFAAFHKAHPQVAERMLRLARARLDRGETFISVKALWEELRVSFQRSENAYDGYEPFKLNNSYTALYARLIIELEPRLATAIEVRRRKGEASPRTG